MSSCPFCDLIKTGQSVRLLPHWALLANRAPVVAGHVLLVPLEHRERLIDLVSPELATLGDALVRTCAFLRFRHAAGDFDVALQDGVAAGQTVPHLHLHVIPRAPDDLPNGVDWSELVTGRRELPSELREWLSPPAYRLAVEQLQSDWGAFAAAQP